LGAQFGVILIPRDGVKVEVATFRSDAGYSDGRQPGQRGLFERRRRKMCSAANFTINVC